MCVPTGDGVYINPSLKIGLTSECIDYCNPPYGNNWKVTDKNDVAFPSTSDHFPVGNTGPDFGIAVKFFDDNSNAEDLLAGVQVTDGNGNIGTPCFPIMPSIGSFPTLGVKSHINTTCRIIPMSSTHSSNFLQDSSLLPPFFHCQGHMPLKCPNLASQSHFSHYYLR
ncbi:hypothetical protein SK128_002076 [Halocaridina rubra]|uniref:Uncharacterized protein n=1 Tax=Halocaridina rubra TaxID=373956 RepID=A0AAN8X0A5_HALRR